MLRSATQRDDTTRARAQHIDQSQFDRSADRPGREVTRV
jgi:hypothetical protein